MNPTEKTCTKCGHTKPVAAFGKHKLGQYGLQPRCRDCRRDENAAYRAANTDKRAAYNASYYQQNRQAVLEKNKAWNKANRDSINRATEAWRKRNPAKVRRQKLASRSGLPADYTTPEKLEARLELYGGRCFYCGADADTIDHRIPTTRGGTNLPANLVPACAKCNSKKHTRTPKEWRAI